MQPIIMGLGQLIAGLEYFRVQSTPRPFDHRHALPTQAVGGTLNRLNRPLPGLSARGFSVARALRPSSPAARYMHQGYIRSYVHPDPGIALWLPLSLSLSL